MTDRHSADLVWLFDGLFERRYCVCLRGGAAEPFYAPATEHGPAVIHFRADYFSSALHEVAHWCLAGEARRRRPDYGYWYAPDGRDAAAQAAFETVEVAPQALEWLFADAAGHPFRASVDNLEAGSATHQRFAAALERERARRLRVGLPPRAAAFRTALLAFFRDGGHR
ncbi:MAG: diaminobutyrate-2-oxoglutarate aminotransferase [Gammaproteobacteria bacterium]|nr:MAG: diaminobutyrate-2-oxoglutarate aminotransferase [Gammaproteobacteria bacterium]